MPNEQSVAEKTALHTPGPWVFEVIDDRSRADLHIDSPFAWWIAEEGVGGEVVAVVEDAQFDRGQANARLVAAAPKLLQRLKSISEARACSCNLEPFVDGPVPCKTCQIRAEIAAAEGRS